MLRSRTLQAALDGKVDALTKELSKTKAAAAADLAAFSSEKVGSVQHPLFPCPVGRTAVHNSVLLFGVCVVCVATWCTSVVHSLRQAVGHAACA
jgi:hypothetical protein